MEKVAASAANVLQFFAIKSFIIIVDKFYSFVPDLPKNWFSSKPTTCYFLYCLQSCIP